MARVVVLVLSTFWRGQPLRKGEVVSVDDETAERWVKKGIATRASAALPEPVPAAPIAQEAPSSPLPPSLPGRGALLAAGYETVEGLLGLTVAELKGIKGIGVSTAKRLHAALRE